MCVSYSLANRKPRANAQNTVLLKDGRGAIQGSEGNNFRGRSLELAASLGQSRHSGEANRRHGSEQQTIDRATPEQQQADGCHEDNGGSNFI
ncbi:hypothetical protein T08_15009 [Trichinella sp. T8]|nr:hypothetical protein T08_15009 [Trichinella sp. T8]